MQSEGFHPNEVTYSMLLKACAINRDIHKGTQIHDEILRVGLSGKHAVLDTALVDMYAKCGNLWKAQEVFDELIARDLISWAVLLAGYVHHGKGVEALERYKRMKVEGLSPNAFIYAVILKACGITREIYKGKHIHDEIISHQLLGSDIVLGTALIDMYSKCGLPNKAHGVLEELPFRNLVSWNSLIGGYAHLCEIDEAFHCFQQMQHEGIFPNEVTFISMLHACRHSGLENEGELVYVNMKTTYGIKPNLRHHIYMIDILSHAGHFEKAMAAIEEMQTSDYLPIWSSILGACLKLGNLRVGRLAFEHAISLDKSNAAAYSCMEKIYITAGMYEEAQKIRDMMANNMLF
ncbi:hypothetical protein KP509_32G026500 [Ceratopteris richardii]|nr:hypothetical protein KP509_32G026500 [Ceratopteris richardii]